MPTRRRHILFSNSPSRTSRLVSVLVGLVRTLRLDADIPRLHVGQLRQLRAELGELQSRHFFIEMLWQYIDADGILLGVGEQFDLRQYLIRKRGTHHVR